LPGWSSAAKSSWRHWNPKAKGRQNRDARTHDSPLFSRWRPSEGNGARRAFVYRRAKAGARIDVIDQKQPHSKVNDTRDKGDVHERLDRLAQDLDDLEKEAIPPKVKPADVGGIIGD
jgi:hypothetical protein